METLSLVVIKQTAILKANILVKIFLIHYRYVWSFPHVFRYFIFRYQAAHCCSKLWPRLPKPCREYSKSRISWFVFGRPKLYVDDNCPPKEIHWIFIAGSAREFFRSCRDFQFQCIAQIHVVFSSKDPVHSSSAVSSSSLHMLSFYSNNQTYVGGWTIQLMVACESSFICPGN